MRPPVESREVLHVQYGVFEMKMTTQMLVQFAVAAGLYRADGSAFEAVRDMVSEREERAWGSESGRRLETVRARIVSTNEQIAAAKSELERAEADHFQALGGDSGSAIEAARDKVLSSQSKINLLEREAKSLTTIHAEALADFGTYVETELPRLHADIAAAAQAKQAAEVAAITQIIEESGLLQRLKALAVATEQLAIIGSDGHALRLACNDLQLSELFGRRLPPNHVSRRSPEFNELSPAQRQAAHVRA